MINDITNNIKDVYRFNYFDKKFDTLINSFKANDFIECAVISGDILCGMCKAISMTTDVIYEPYILKDSRLALVYDAFGNSLNKQFANRFKSLLLDEVIVTNNIRSEDNNEDYINEIFKFINDVADELNKHYGISNFDVFKINMFKKSYTEHSKKKPSPTPAHKSYYKGSGKNSDSCISATASLTRGLGVVEKGAIFKKKLFNLKLELDIENPNDYKFKSIKLIVKFSDSAMGDMSFDLDKQNKIVKDINLPFEEFKKGINAYVEIEYKLDLFKFKQLQIQL